MTLLDVYRGSKELKNSVVQRARQFNIPFRYICREIGYDYHHFMFSYINSRDSDRCEITEKQFEKMFDLLGIEKRIQFVIKEKHDGEQVREMLKKKYESDS